MKTAFKGLNMRRDSELKVYGDAWWWQHQAVEVHFNSTELMMNSTKCKVLGGPTATRGAPTTAILVE